MSRYFSCFSKQPKLPPKQEILLHSPLKIKVPAEDILEGLLPLSLQELKLLEFKVANCMSSINAIANRIHGDYIYCMNNRNLSKAVQLQKLYIQRVKEVRRYSARLQQVQQAIEDITNPPPLSLPPPVINIRSNPIVGRGPSFRKEFSSHPSPIVRA